MSINILHITVAILSESESDCDSDSDSDSDNPSVPDLQRIMQAHNRVCGQTMPIM